jgi:hypothetical protein
MRELNAVRGVSAPGTGLGASAYPLVNYAIPPVTPAPYSVSQVATAITVYADGPLYSALREWLSGNGTARLVADEGLEL